MMEAAKYIACGRAAKHLQYMYLGLKEIGFRVPYPAKLQGDNDSSIAVAENQWSHNCVKHIDIKHHYVCQTVSQAWEGGIELHTKQELGQPVYKSSTMPTAPETM